MKTLLGSLVFFLIIQPVSIFSEEVKSPSGNIYSFAEHLPMAEALRGGEKGTLYGKWGVDRFRFQGLPSTGSDIFISQGVVVAEKVREAISFNPLTGFDSTLVFSQVPSGSQLRIFYAVPDSVFEQSKVVGVNFEVWIGKKKVFETRASSKGWQEKTVDLSLLSLLGRSYRVTFRVSAVDQDQEFAFDAYIE
ncbi:MAG: hypothetical protein HY447_02550 [Candidatus Omnitrophica bacterium]|nr:hypothetical protein [Candidatus Omnitrophota bacterium]